MLMRKNFPRLTRRKSFLVILFQNKSLFFITRRKKFPRPTSEKSLCNNILLE